MIHPDTELRFVNETIGYGVYATALLPKGTILYVKDSLEIEITPNRYSKLDLSFQKLVEKYTYINEKGNRILSWDNAKFVNHKCECNSMSTGYGFEIAIKDIAIGEEITDEYGLFNLIDSMEVDCGCSKCREILHPSDIDTYADQWDVIIQNSLTDVLNIQQPLFNYIDDKTKRDLCGYLKGKKPYKSVKAIKYNPVIHVQNEITRRSRQPSIKKSIGRLS